MSAILFSRDWHRVAHLKPVLRHHVEIHVHSYRGQRSYVLQNHLSGQFRRLTPQAYLIAGLMDGCRTIEDIWQLASERLKDELPTHEELLQLVGSLYQAHLIRMDLDGDAAELFRSGQERQRKKWLAKLRSPLSVQIPLYNPNALLERTGWLSKPFFNGLFALIWFCMVAFLAVMGWRHWDELTSNMADQVLAADNLILLWLIYPLIKLLHELGHAYAIKRYGGQVHEVGVMFLVFFPMPYVDASASTAFASKYQRMLVDGAGMMVELFIASIAMLFWLGAEEGLLRSIAYNTLFIAGVSTLLFNGNPLLRFDGYYLLVDWLEMPNLGQKANQYWGYLAKRFLFRVKQLESIAHSLTESLIYTLYGAGSFVYRLFISITIALFVSQEYFFIGVVLAIWSVGMVWIWPVGKLLWQTWRNQELKRQGISPVLVLPVMTLFLAGFLFLVTAPHTATIDGVVQTTEQGRLVIKENCFFDQWHTASSEQIQPKSPVLDCLSPELSRDIEVNQWLYSETLAQRREAYGDAVKIKLLDQELQNIRQTQAELESRNQALTLTGNAKGTVALLQSGDKYGQWLKRGDVVGYIVAPDTLLIKAMLPEHQVETMEQPIVSATIRSRVNFDREISANRWLLTPSSSRELLSPVLAEQGGGTIKLNAAEQNQTLENYFHLQVWTDEKLEPMINQKVLVQFQLQPEPVGYRLYHYLRRNFLSYFKV